MKQTVYARLARRIKIDPISNCWVCSGWNTGDGYAKIRVNGKCRVAHRALYEEMKGPLPADKVLDHVCNTRACVNPNHLEPVTIRENTLRGNAILFSKKINENTHHI